MQPKVKVHLQRDLETVLIYYSNNLLRIWVKLLLRIPL